MDTTSFQYSNRVIKQSTKLLIDHLITTLYKMKEYPLTRSIAPYGQYVCPETEDDTTKNSLVDSSLYFMTYLLSEVIISINIPSHHVPNLHRPEILLRLTLMESALLPTLLISRNSALYTKRWIFYL